MTSTLPPAWMTLTGAGSQAPLWEAAATIEGVGSRASLVLGVLEDVLNPWHPKRPSIDNTIKPTHVIISQRQNEAPTRLHFTLAKWQAD
jgi:hypothetical protein